MPLTETNFVPEKEIENVTREIEHVTRDIENVDKKINGIDELLAVTTEASERDYLRAEKAQLRVEKDKLRDEKKQLKASASINTNGTASKYQYKWCICEVWLVVIVTGDDLFVYSFIYLFIYFFYGTCEQSMARNGNCKSATRYAFYQENRRL